MKILYLFLIAFVLLFIDSEKANSQATDSRGKEFWLTFMPNIHIFENENSQQLRNGDSCYIFISSEVPTKGTIEYVDANNATHLVNFEIKDPKDMFSISFMYRDVELKGFESVLNWLGSFTYVQNQSEVINKQAFFIKCDDEVAVYCHSQAEMTSDATIVFPADAIGNNYFIMSYPVSYTANQQNVSTPSQFVIIASEDNTVVTIEPKAPTAFNGQSPQVITLQRGEVYLVQSELNSNNPRYDLTGSIVTSNKKISVFSGHRRTAIPINSNAWSRDILIEQMPPINTYGAMFFAVPLASISNKVLPFSDVYRAVAAYDSTYLYEDDVFIKKLNRGEFYEGKIDKVKLVTANQPILFAHFKRSESTRNQIDDEGLSDPFMMIIPPKEQYMAKYHFSTIDAYRYRIVDSTINNSKIYNQHFVSIIIPKEGVSTLKLNGEVLTNIQKSLFATISNTGYVYANIPLSVNVNKLESDSLFGIYVYGFGDHNSYGYVGGMELKNLDSNPPQFYSNISCFEAKGKITEIARYDSKIKRVELDFAENVNVSISSFPHLSDSATFEANLIKPYLDGGYRILAQDWSGSHQSYKWFDLPGFTVSTKTIMSKDTSDSYFRIAKGEKEGCFEITFYNYGKFTQDFTFDLKNGDNFSFSDAQNVTLKAKESKKIKICYTREINQDLIDTLFVSTSCAKRNIAVLEVSTVRDNNDPSITGVDDNCQNPQLLTIADNKDKFDWGLEYYKVTDSSNVSFAELQDNIGSSKILQVELIDKLSDGFFILQAQDSSGRQSLIERKIYGDALEIIFEDGREGKVGIDNILFGSRHCGEFEIVNNGLFERVIEFTNLKYNYLFSIPKSQFPITIKPNDVAKVSYCVDGIGEIAKTYDEVISFKDICYPKEAEFQVKILDNILETANRCEIKIKLQLNEHNTSFINSIYPNPATDVIKTEMAIVDENQSRFELRNASGILLREWDFTNLSKGIYDISLDVSDVSSGIYFLTFNTSNSKIVEKVAIVK